MRNVALRVARIVTVGALLLAFSGCGSVVTKTPIGMNPYETKANEWDGTWLVGEGVIFVKVTDEKKGELQLATCEYDEDKFIVKSFKALLRKTGDAAFVNLRALPGDDDTYVCMRVKRSDDELFVWLPDVNKFKDLVEAKKLPGTVKPASGNEGTRVTLGELDKKHQELIVSEEEGVLFEWRNPLVLRRLTKEKQEKEKKGKEKKPSK